ncbi:hypothetical protein LTS08_000536 [Lithohypha guttulata]|nr:hypothetical protein LTS08_000536 [Lithohypha guttulata]
MGFFTDLLLGSPKRVAVDQHGNKYFVRQKRPTERPATTSRSGGGSSRSRSTSDRTSSSSSSSRKRAPPPPARSAPRQAPSRVSRARSTGRTETTDGGRSSRFHDRDSLYDGGLRETLYFVDRSPPRQREREREGRGGESRYGVEGRRGESQRGGSRHGESRRGESRHGSVRNRDERVRSKRPV